MNLAKSVSSSRVIKRGNEISSEQTQSWEVSEELRGTPGLWIVIYVFVPENVPCLLVDILASLFEEASLRYLRILV